MYGTPIVSVALLRTEGKKGGYLYEGMGNNVPGPKSCKLTRPAGSEAHLRSQAADARRTDARRADRDRDHRGCQTGGRKSMNGGQLTHDSSECGSQHTPEH